MNINQREDADKAKLIIPWVASSIKGVRVDDTRGLNVYRMGKRLIKVGLFYVLRVCGTIFPRCSMMAIDERETRVVLRRPSDSRTNEKIFGDGDILLLHFSFVN